MGGVIKILALSVLLGILVACKPPATESQSRVWTIEAKDIVQLKEECHDFLDLLKNEYGHAINQSGFLQVPLDWDDRFSPSTAHVFYYGRIDSSLGTPFIFFNGGPGSSSHSSFKNLFDAKLLNDVNFIFMDQRGTGCSSDYPIVNSLSNFAALDAYGSREIVFDAEAVRFFGLMLPKWQIFGQSYGAFIVHRYLSMAPQSITAAHAHGFAIMQDKRAWKVARAMAQIEISQLLEQTYPQLASQVFHLKAIIDDTYCIKQGGISICGKAIIEGGTTLMGFRNRWQELANYFDSFIDLQNQVNTDALESFARRFMLPRRSREALAVAVIDYTDLHPGEYVFDDPSGCKQFSEELSHHGYKPETSLFSECRWFEPRALDQETSAIIKGMGFDPVSLENIARNIKQYNIPFFLYAGVYDAYVPPSVFTEELNALQESVTFTLFQESGHEGFYTEPLVWQNIKGF